MPAARRCSGTRSIRPGSIAPWQWLAAQGRVPYILVERREEAEFRDRFRGHADIGALDWPPRFNIGGQSRIFDPLDRARYLAGEAYATENIRRGR